MELPQSEEQPIPTKVRYMSETQLDIQNMKKLTRFVQRNGNSSSGPGREEGDRLTVTRMPHIQAGKLHTPII